ncbi:MAG: Holliday junction resolvase RecU [Defluviitaleaceae bacterium]|nr:Holliday junction resolvase RecU [Defluviitaleaceae bacterium]
MRNRGLRGSSFEEIINLTNELYREKNLAIIQKIPTPITPVSFEKNTKIITKAYFEKKSTVDYIGVAQGVPICFDAKETSQKSFSLQNVHEHQIKFMKDFVNQRGYAFLLVNFVVYEQCFILPFDCLKTFWEQSKRGGKKSIPYEKFNKNLIVNKSGIYFHYLEIIAKDLI